MRARRPRCFEILSQTWEQAAATATAGARYVSAFLLRGAQSRDGHSKGCGAPLVVLGFHVKCRPRNHLAPPRRPPAAGQLAKIYFSSQFAPLIIFFVMFLSVVKNTKLHHFVRFSCMQARAAVG